LKLVIVYKYIAIEILDLRGSGGGSETKEKAGKVIERIN
jgi:hypothetical protein